jgi:hypothetical protein
MVGCCCPTIFLLGVGETMQHYEYLIGIAVQTFLFLLGVYGMILRNDSSNKNLKAEVISMRDELKKLAAVIVQQAVQTEQIDNLRTQVTLLQRTVEDMRRGNGWVKGRTGVDGEYGN